VSVPVTVSFDASARGIEIRCRRCKSHAVLIAAAAPPPATTTSASDDELRAAE